MIYSTNEVLEILNISRPTLYKLFEELDFQPKRTSKKGKYVFSETDILLLKNFINSKHVGKKIFLSNIYDDVLNLLMSYSKQIDPKDGEEIFNNFFKNYGKRMILNKTKLN